MMNSAVFLMILRKVFQINAALRYNVFWVIVVSAALPRVEIMTNSMVINSGAALKIISSPKVRSLTIRFK